MYIVYMVYIHIYIYVSTYVYICVYVCMCVYTLVRVALGYFDVISVRVSSDRLP